MEKGQNSSSGCLGMAIMDYFSLNLASIGKMCRGKLKIQVREVGRGKYLYFGSVQV